MASRSSPREQIAGPQRYRRELPHVQDGTAERKRRHDRVHPRAVRSRASTQGDVASTRRPRGATMRSITWRTASSPSNRRSATSLDPPLPLHVDVVGAVHHHLGDLGVLEQELDRTHPDDRIRNRVHHVRERALCRCMCVPARAGESASSRTRSRRSARGIASSRASTRPISAARTVRRTSLSASSDHDASSTAGRACRAPVRSRASAPDDRDPGLDRRARSDGIIGDRCCPKSVRRRWA